MNTRLGSWLSIVALVGGLGLLTGCETSDSGSSQTSATGYYGTGFNDPWYYGDTRHDNIIVTPPEGPNKPAPPQPSHPIASPPSSGPRPMPMPSIPSTPRPSGGGGRGR